MSTQGLRWLESLLRERLQPELCLQARTDGQIHLTLAKQQGLISLPALSDCFLQSTTPLACSDWHSTAEGWDSALHTHLPAPGADQLPSPLIDNNGSYYQIGYDILGLTYWMLSRQEEVGRTDLDQHGRFPATASHAYQHGYLERPLVDEWLHILRQVVQRTWPQLQLNQAQFSIKVSHDVDNPSYYAFRPWTTLARICAGHLLKRFSPWQAIQTPLIKLNSKHHLHPSDPANTFAWIMDTSEQQGLNSAFYFICGRSEASKDADYEIEHPAMRALMREIHKRGHELGLHPSYNAYQALEVISNEAQRLKTVCEQEGIQQANWGGRMHYLRWEQPTTLYGWEQAGMSYDSTLGYADHAGFRCGTCFEYPAFDPVKQQALNLRIRPLIAMECSVIDPIYMNLGYGEAALNKFIELKNKCKAVGGNFTLLWHNSRLIDPLEKNLYQTIIKT